MELCLFSFLLEYGRNLCLSTSKVKARSEAEYRGAVGCSSSFLSPKQEPRIPLCSQAKALSLCKSLFKTIPFPKGTALATFYIYLCA